MKLHKSNNTSLLLSHMLQETQRAVITEGIRRKCIYKHHPYLWEQSILYNIELCKLIEEFILKIL